MSHLIPDFKGGYRKVDKGTFELFLHAAEVASAEADTSNDALYADAIKVVFDRLLDNQTALD